MNGMTPTEIGHGILFVRALVHNNNPDELPTFDDIVARALRLMGEKNGEGVVKLIKRRMKEKHSEKLEHC